MADWIATGFAGLAKVQEYNYSTRGLELSSTPVAFQLFLVAPDQALLTVLQILCCPPGSHTPGPSSRRGQKVYVPVCCRTCCNVIFSMSENPLIDFGPPV